jgi:TubC N-terminal docking domain
VTPPAPLVAALLADLAARGVELAAEGGRLRYRPKGAVTAALAQRLAGLRAEVLGLVSAGIGYTTAELGVLARAGLGPADVPVVGAVKAAFAGMGGLTVVGFDPAATDMTPDDLPADWREMYEERAGIMEFDGNLPRDRAERLALRDIAALMQRAHGPGDAAVPARGRDVPWPA